MREIQKSLRFGVLWPFRNSEFARVPWEQLYRTHLDLIADSEAMGFDDAWLTEHHFQYEDIVNSHILNCYLLE